MSSLRATRGGQGVRGNNPSRFDFCFVFGFSFFREEVSNFHASFQQYTITLDSKCPPPPKKNPFTSMLLHSVCKTCFGILWNYCWCNDNQMMIGVGCWDEKAAVQAGRSPRFHHEGLPLPYIRGAEHGWSLRWLRRQRLGRALRVCLAPPTPIASPLLEG